MSTPNSALPLPSQYRDNKKPLWLLAVVAPLAAPLGPVLYLNTGNTTWLWIFLALFYVGLPLLDRLFGEDRHNPPEAAVPRLEDDAYYRWVTYALVPILTGCFVFNIAFLATEPLAPVYWWAVAITTGSMLGFGLNVSHELGHKKRRLDQWLALWTQSLGAYGHFSIEHNRGHHRDVATPEDPASSKMGESIYRFMLRELPGAFKRAWQLEAERLERKGHSRWNARNEILQGLAMTALVHGSLVIAFGWPAVMALLVVSLWGAFQLTSANYIEHYGLLRKKLDNGQYERCQPHHSWNSNHLVSNLVVLQLQRHSDHHANPARGFQSLRDFPELPSLPSGYFAMFLVAYVPPLWFRVMNPRLLQAVGRDASRINFLPGKKAALVKEYGLA
ncbi:MAG TPA: alkane 1-monooxygenase [Limnobacter sp.]|uniref:alkane 1-monooxygenase n=1 Tax=Limnobacter sp. TaxID=2003368 RepID=UPI002EDB7C39